MIKIKVHRQASFFILIIIYILAVMFISAVVYLAISGVLEKVWGWVSVLAFMLILTPFVVNKVFDDKTEYVSDLIINDRTLELVYRVKNKVVMVKRILIEDIESVFTTSGVSIHETEKIPNAYSITTIELKNGDLIRFEETPSKFCLCPYSFLLKLLKNIDYIPNFSYVLKSKNKNVKTDLRYFEYYGKRKPKIRARKLKYIKMAIAAWLITFLLGTGYFIYMNQPVNKLSALENGYIAKLNSGKSYYKEKSYSSAIIQFEKAQKLINTDYNLYLEKAKTYNRLKKYDMVILEAKTALNLLDSKKESVYDKSSRNRFIGENSGKTSAYTYLANANFELKNYQEAIIYYTKIIETTSYKYSNAYFWRGVCKFYLNDKKGALADFRAHEDRIIKYLHQMKKTERPQYSKDDMVLVKKWIKITGG